MWPMPMACRIMAEVWEILGPSAMVSLYLCRHLQARRFRPSPLIRRAMRWRDRTSSNVYRDYVGGLPIHREDHVDLAASAQCKRQSHVDLVESGIVGSRSGV